MSTFPSYQRNLFKDWENYEEEVFKNPLTVGKCGFLSYYEDNLIGFASWDPRQRPNIGIIGQNCILPKFQGRGFGKIQVKEIMRILKRDKFQNVKVTTGEHEFFVPAQKMYESCGFKEKRRYRDPSNPFFNVIELWIELI